MPHFHHCSMFNQNQSISNLVIFEQNTKAIALLFGQNCLIFITFQCSIKINQFQIWSFLSKILREQNTKGIALLSLTFWPKMPHFHHFSMFNQNQSISNLVICGQTCLIFITFQCSIKAWHQSIPNLVILSKIPRL